MLLINLQISIILFTFLLDSAMKPDKLQLEESIDQVHKKMERFTVDNNNIATYMLGLTGSGKSTFINYLLGAKDYLKVTKRMGQF